MTGGESSHAGAVSRLQVTPLRRPADALNARLSLINDAQRTIDLQYYLWNSDAVGYVMLDRLLAAANRGVSVRLLVDDLKLRSRTRSIASLCLHPNLEVKVFNPFKARSNVVTEGIEFIRHFAQLDQRMHNKLLVVDGEHAVFGGRNIADEHFGLHKAFNFIDFDVVFRGPEVRSLSDVFDSYWQDPSSISGSALDTPASPSDLVKTEALIANELRSRMPLLAGVLSEEKEWPDRARSMMRSLPPQTVTIVHDTPGTSVGPIQVREALRATADAARHDILIVTPFFVPSDVHVAWYRQMIDRGVRMRVLTNSLASNPGTISNSGLDKQRMALVKAGVELFELRTDAATKTEWEIPPVSGRYLALHAKLYLIDRERMFIGSVNLDPRSKFVNTEIGVLIDDAGLAGDAADAVLPFLASENSWEVGIGPGGGLRWVNDTETLRRQPARSSGQRAADWIFGLLPIGDYI